MSHQLTSGICERLHFADTSETLESLNTAPTVQLLSIKKVTGNNSATERYRIIISDGEHFLQAMLATQLNFMVEENQIQKNTIAILQRFTASLVQNKKLIIILELKVVAVTASKIGDPVTLVPPADKTETPAAQNGSTSMTPAPQQQPQQQQQQRQTSSASKPQGQSSRAGQKPVYPIEGLSPYQNNWTIRARVTQKSDMRVYSNQRGEGKLFSVTLMDESGEIKGTAFNAVADELYDKFQEGKVYYISKARVNLAKKKFSNLSNDYELSLERNTEIEECQDITDLPAVKYNFTPLSSLTDLPKDSSCDVIGIVQDVSDLAEITSAKMQRTIPKRDMTLVDKSSFSVRLTLWGKQAQEWATDGNPVIAFKGVRVGDFGGRSLSMVNSSTMTIDPDITEAHGLRGWYDSLGHSQAFQSHSNGMGGGAGAGGGSFSRAEMRTLQDVRDSNLGNSDKAEYFSARGTIMHIKTENISYPACPTQGCNKKVIEGNDGWRCEKCDRSFEGPEHRYIIAIAVADYTGQAWLQGFNDVGVIMFGMTANELLAKKDNNEAEFNAVVYNATCRTYNFSCRAKQDFYNEIARVRYGISKIAEPDWGAETAYLKELINSPWGRS